MSQTRKTNRRSSRDQHRIDTIVSMVFKIKIMEIHSQSTKRKIADARMAAMYLQKELLGKSFPKIAAYFKKKSHSTIINAHQAITALIETNQAFREKINQCIKRFSAYTIEKVKQKYNIHFYLKKVGISVSSQNHTIYMAPEIYNNLTGRKKVQVTRLMKLHNYSLQLIID